ncbi:hypothetical protein PIROE2DRAFT_16226 [Piromyces sp. E2]|nr:hypothetical protein PIROE2DRAFT_16226 [Piromyces sp. E2]|eukprot:OUM58483.1 hypothetical protein PIROE2DRAFT_16226 [Piromyces sp. E2]
MGYDNYIRSENVNAILLRRINKIIIKEEEDLNSFFKKNLETSLKYDSNRVKEKHIIVVENCNLLNCVINIDDIKFEFENGNLISKNTIEDENFVKDIVIKTVKDETKRIIEKLKFALTLNENLNNFGYCIDIEVVKKIAFYNENDYELFYSFLIRKLKEIVGTEKEYNPSYPNFPRKCIDSDTIYTSYCQWLYVLESLNSNSGAIPESYKTNFTGLDKINTLKVISVTNREEYNQLMSALINSPEPFTSEDVTDLDIFFSYETGNLAFVPDTMPCKDNLHYIARMVLQYNTNNISDKKQLINRVKDMYDKVNYTVDDIIKFSLVFSHHHPSDIGKLKVFNYYFSSSAIELLYKLLKHSNNRYAKFLKYKNVWARLVNKLNIFYYETTYPDVCKDLKRIAKQNVYNNIFVQKRRQLIVDKKENLDDFYKELINNSIKQDDYLSSVNHNIVVDQCNLLNCKLIVDDTTIEFENGILLTNETSIDKSVLDKLQKILEKETKIISDKLNIILSLNENISKIGFCLDIDLVKAISLYDENEIDEFGFFLCNELKTLQSLPLYYTPGSYNDLVYIDFPREHLTSQLTYFSYCKWLYTLETLNCDKKKIPMSYKIEFENNPNIDRIKMDIGNSSLKIVTVGEEDQFFNMITTMMNAPEALSTNDISYLKKFMAYEENYIKYIPETITNKENLAYIANAIIKHHHNNPPMDVILPLFKNVNDVLRLALVMSNQSPSDLGKRVAFISFKNPERRLLMKLLNNCTNRYEDILKYKSKWVLLCEKIHPNKYKKIYPDLVNDLLGSYSFLGNKENKPKRIEYRFYKSLMEIDDRFQEYKNEMSKFIELERKRIFRSINDINILEEDNFVESLNQFKWIAIVGNRNRRTTNLRQNYAFSYRKPVSEVEHQKLFEIFKTIKEMPSETKEYIQEYLLKLSGIVYSDLLQKLNNQFIVNYSLCRWNYRRGNVDVDKKNEDIFNYTPTLLMDYTNHIVPQLNRDLIEKEVKRLQPHIIKLHDEDRQYKKERSTFDSKLVALINDKKIDEAAQLLSQKPGIYLRHLDELITKGNQSNLVIDILEKIAQKGSVKVLLSVKGYFQKRNEKLKNRSFLIKNATGSSKKKSNRITSGKGGEVTGKNAIYFTSVVKEPLSKDICERILTICDNALLCHFEHQGKLNGVYISPEIEKFIIPFDLRNASKGLENFTKGSRIDLSFKNITEEEKKMMVEDVEHRLRDKEALEEKLYTEKKQLDLQILNLKDKEGKEDQEQLKIMEKELITVEKDLTAMKNMIERLKSELHEKKNCPIGTNYQNIRLFMLGIFQKIFIEVYDENCNFKTLVTNFNSANKEIANEYNIYYHDEQKNVTYMDINIDTVLEHQGRYVVVNVLPGSGKFGWMEVPFLNSEESFDPSAVRQSISIKYTGDACPVILDCETREFIWIDHVSSKNYFRKYVDSYVDYHHQITYVNAVINLMKQGIPVPYRDPFATEEVPPLIVDGVNLSNVDVQDIKNTIENYNKYCAINDNFKKALFSYYIDPMRLSMSELIHLHIKARQGTLLEKEEDLKEGDIAFVPYTPFTKKDKVDYVSCSQLEVILSEYMK